MLVRSLPIAYKISPGCLAKQGMPLLNSPDATLTHLIYCHACTILCHRDASVLPHYPLSHLHVCVHIILFIWIYFPPLDACQIPIHPSKPKTNGLSFQ